MRKSKSLGLRKVHLISALIVFSVANQPYWEEKERLLVCFRSKQLKQGIPSWQCVGKEVMPGQMLCKQECYMFMIYNEVHRFEQNAVLSYGTNTPNYSSQFVQYVADNADHNIRTLDGNDTFHGMGMIAIVTPGTKNSNQILRVKVTPAAVGRVPVYYHNSVGMTAVVFEKLHNFRAEDPTAYLDVLWKSSILFGSPRPAWSGMMQLVHCGSIPGKSSVMFLPMIDMNPSDTSCIYSTLKYIREHAHRHDVTPIITFDQPLLWKALMIILTEPIESDLRDIVLKLGGFHIEMSFLGALAILWLHLDYRSCWN